MQKTIDSISALREVLQASNPRYLEFLSAIEDRQSLLITYNISCSRRSSHDLTLGLSTTGKIMKELPFTLLFAKASSSSEPVRRSNRSHWR
jgi:hypothetical protein